MLSADFLDKSMKMHTFLKFFWYIREQDNRVWKLMICIKNVKAGAYTPFGSNDGVSQSYKVSALYHAARFQNSLWYFLTLSRLYSTVVS